MSEALDYLGTFVRYPAALRKYLRHRLTLAEARRIVQERMAAREANFLANVERAIYAQPGSPYRALLRQAGCELGDVQALVNRAGLEGALQSLREAGVYVTFEEFKGRKPIVRGGLELKVAASDFDNPFAQSVFQYQTGGSTGAAVKVAVDLDYIAARAAHRLIVLDAHGMLGAPTAIWRGMLPDGGLRPILRGAYLGNVPLRWFSPIGWRDSRHWLKYGAATLYLMAWLRLLGVRVPWPQVARGEQAVVVARWAAETARKYGRALVRTNVSRGARLGLAAQAAGLDLMGVTLMGGGEPATPAKVRQMSRAGMRYVSNYGMVEASTIGSGCAAPVDEGDVHLFKDAVALFAHPLRLEQYDVTVPAFNLTTLLPSSPKVMLNVEMDDYGVVEERHCGCELEAYGFTTHLRQIRSYSKLTGEGVTLIGTEMQRILEEVLPERFGGGPLDYQLLEEEDEQGFTRICLVVHPSVALADERAVTEGLLDALRQSSPAGDAARIFWQSADAIRVKRMEPVWTGRGKLMPLHIARRATQNLSPKE